MSLPKILVSSRMFGTLQEPMSLLTRQGYVIAENPWAGQTLREEQLLRLIEDVDGVLAGDDDFTAAVLEKARCLKVISKFGVGVDRIDLAEATRKGIQVTNAPGTNKHAVADMTLGLMVAVARSIPLADARVRAGDFKVIVGHSVYGGTLGVIGLGQIGQEVVRRAKGFNMRVLAYDPYADTEFVRENDVIMSSLAELMQEADFITLHLPSLPETKKIINRELLSAVKPGAVLINTARGDLVDEVALWEALSSGRLAGAALDTFAVEPPAIEHPLLQLKNVVVTAHMGGHTKEAHHRTGMVAAENLVRVLQGHPPLHLVNKAVSEEHAG